MHTVLLCLNLVSCTVIGSYFRHFLKPERRLARGEWALFAACLLYTCAFMFLSNRIPDYPK